VWLVGHNGTLKTQRLEVAISAMRAMVKVPCAQLAGKNPARQVVGDISNPECLPFSHK